MNSTINHSVSQVELKYNLLFFLSLYFTSNQPWVNLFFGQFLSLLSIPIVKTAVLSTTVSSGFLQQPPDQACWLKTFPLKCLLHTVARVSPNKHKMIKDCPLHKTTQLISVSPRIKSNVLDSTTVSACILITIPLKAYPGGHPEHFFFLEQPLFCLHSFITYYSLCPQYCFPVLLWYIS